MQIYNVLPTGLREAETDGVVIYVEVPATQIMDSKLTTTSTFIIPFCIANSCKQQQQTGTLANMHQSLEKPYNSCSN